MTGNHADDPRDAHLSQLYRLQAVETPPAHLDQAVRAQAASAAHPPRARRAAGGRIWALAGSVVALVVVVGLVSWMVDTSPPQSTRTLEMDTADGAREETERTVPSVKGPPANASESLGNGSVVESPDDRPSATVTPAPSTTEQPVELPDEAQ